MQFVCTNDVIAGFGLCMEVMCLLCVVVRRECRRVIGMLPFTCGIQSLHMSLRTYVLCVCVCILTHRLHKEERERKRKVSSKMSY